MCLSYLDIIAACGHPNLEETKTPGRAVLACPIFFDPLKTATLTNCHTSILNDEHDTLKLPFYNCPDCIAASKGLFSDSTPACPTGPGLARFREEDRVAGVREYSYNTGLRFHSREEWMKEYRKRMWSVDGSVPKTKAAPGSGGEKMLILLPENFRGGSTSQ